MSKLGKCPNCGEFGTFIKNPEADSKQSNKGQKLTVAETAPTDFRKLGHKELERVFTNGIKPGATYLLAGAPGIGKSTLLLQLLALLGQKNKGMKIAYFSAEETGSQINERYQRVVGDEQLTIDLYQGFHIEDLLETADDYDLIAVDSIQTVYAKSNDSLAGSPSQVKTCSEAIVELCKKKNIAALIVGHITKGGDIAGPKYLEHLVDVVLYLEGDRHGNLRFLRCRKNRYGNTEDVAIFEMKESGLTPPKNLHELMQSNASDMPGSVFTVGIDNGRPVLVNLEVLINKTTYKYPQRTAIGIDKNRLNLVIAILEKYLNIRLGGDDIFVNIPGELAFRDSGIDLALVAALYSQSKKITIDNDLIFIGEIGLGGQVLPSKFHTKRCKEAKNCTIIDNDRLDHVSQLPKLL